MGNSQAYLSKSFWGFILFGYSTNFGITEQDLGHDKEKLVFNYKEQQKTQRVTKDEAELIKPRTERSDYCKDDRFDKNNKPIQSMNQEHCIYENVREQDR